jgi:2',3'-cyclic-nucleotide 2'-phosphodiesterase (5'-nucleotidase family)
MFRLLRYTLFFVILSACVTHLKVFEVKSSHYELKSLKNDSASLAGISPYKSGLDAEMKQVIAYSDSAFTREGFESSLGNLVCMAMKEFIKTDTSDLADQCVYIMNRGGLRNNLPQGEITKGNIFELMPFDNEIAVVTISGEKMMGCIKATLENKKIFSHNLLMRVNKNIPEEISIHGKPFDINKNYTVITTDYLAMGGDNCTFFMKPIFYSSTGTKLRDAIIAYCERQTKNKTTLKPSRFGHVRISK